MSEFFVRPFLGEWAVVYNGILYSRTRTPEAAVAAAVEFAARAAAHNGPKRVILERPGHESSVVWDSTRDSFNLG